MGPLPVGQRERARALYKGYPGLHGGIDAALEGRHGDVFVDDPAGPRVARIVIGDFHMLAGDPGAPAALEALRAVPARDYLAVPELWHDFVRSAAIDARPYDRFSFRAPAAWDHDRLAGMRNSLPAGFTLRRIAAADFHAFRDLNPTFVANFPSIDDFLARGVGFGVTSDSGEMVAGCSSYTISSRCLEFEIETRPDFQRRGLALVTGSAVIEYCLDNRLEPCWDAAHAGSADLAERLGFVGRRRYTAYGIGVTPGPNES